MYWKKSSLRLKNNYFPLIKFRFVPFINPLFIGCSIFHEKCTKNRTLSRKRVKFRRNLMICWSHEKKAYSTRKIWYRFDKSYHMNVLGFEYHVMIIAKSHMSAPWNKYLLSWMKKQMSVSKYLLVFLTSKVYNLNWNFLLIFVRLAC